MPEAVTNASAPTVTGCLSAGSQDQGKDEIVPREDKRQHGGRGDPGPRQRDRDPPEGAKPAIAVDAVCVFDILADVLEIAAHDPQDQRQRDQLIDPDQAEISVDQAKRLEVDRQWQQDEKRRGKPKRQKRESDVLSQPEPEACKGVGGWHPEDQGQ